MMAINLHEAAQVTAGLIASDPVAVSSSMRTVAQMFRVRPFWFVMWNICRPVLLPLDVLMVLLELFARKVREKTNRLADWCSEGVWREVPAHKAEAAAARRNAREFGVR